MDFDTSFPSFVSAYENGIDKDVLSDLQKLLDENRKRLQEQNNSPEYIQEFLKDFKQGFLQGVWETEHKIAKAMKADGVDQTLISKYTGLSLDEINKL